MIDRYTHVHNMTLVFIVFPGVHRQIPRSDPFQTSTLSHR